MSLKEPNVNSIFVVCSFLFTRDCRSLRLLYKWNFECIYIHTDIRVHKFHSFRTTIFFRICLTEAYSWSLWTIWSHHTPSLLSLSHTYTHKHKFHFIYLRATTICICIYSSKAITAYNKYKLLISLSQHTQTLTQMHF